MKRLAFLSAILVASAAHSAPIKRAAQPTLSPDGETLVFTWQNDLWRVSAKGGRAERLTVHPAVDSTPRWSPDGTQIAFTSNRYGSNDVFTMKQDGTDIQRLTFDSASETISSWTPDSKRILGSTNSWGRANLFSVNAKGGDLVQLTNHVFELQFYPSVSPTGQTVAYVGGGSPSNWRNPSERGTDTGEIWLGTLGTPVTNCRKLTSDESNDSFPNFAPDGSLIFMSNRGGSPNLWRMAKDGKGLKQLTKHNGGTLRWPVVSANGKVASYEYDSEIWNLNLETGISHVVNIHVPDDAVLNPVQDLTLTTGASEYVASPDGKRAVIGVRGDLFLIPERGGTTRKLATSLAWDVSPQWLDNRTVLFVSGRGGHRQLLTVDLDGKDRIFHSDPGDLTCPTISPNGQWIAFHKNDREIQIISSAGGIAKTIVRGGFPDALKNVAAFSWSSDSKAITYVDQTVRASTVSVVDISSGKSTSITRVAHGSDTPRFLPNGRSIYYTSNEFDSNEVVIVDLVPSDVVFSEDDLDGIDATKPSAIGNDVRIDTRGLQYRVRRLTNGGGVAFGASPDSRNILASVSGQLTLLPVSGGPGSAIAGTTSDPGNIQVVNNKAYFTAGGRPTIFNFANNSASTVPFSAQITVDRKKEDLALFEEMWWAIDRIYYDAHHHGKDWNAIRAEYAALVPYCFDRQDYYALMFEMIEELDSSHIFTTSPPAQAPQANESTAFTGIEWDWAELSAGRYLVKSVVPNSAAAHPAMLILPGDQVTSVDGVHLGAGTTFTELMKNRAGTKVLLGLTRKGVPTSVAIKPMASGTASALRYEEFVAKVREQVEQDSGGKLTYFHIQGMNAPSTERFFREMRMYGEGKQGAIVDVRWNGGGNTANQILAAMRIQPWLLRKFRSWPDLEMTEDMFRGEALEMPVALMTNQYSASNAEIFSEGFRQMKLGPIIGEPTGGNVLTVGGTYSFWDGGAVQIPFVAILAIDGKPLEGIGRRVDVDVRYDPNAWNAGQDNQAEAATRELLKRAK